MKMAERFKNLKSAADLDRKIALMKSINDSMSATNSKERGELHSLLNLLGMPGVLLDLKKSEVDERLLAQIAHFENLDFSDKKILNVLQEILLLMYAITNALTEKNGRNCRNPWDSTLAADENMEPALWSGTPKANESTKVPERMKQSAKRLQKTRRTTDLQHKNATVVMAYDSTSCRTDSSAQIHELDLNRKKVDVQEEQPKDITRNISPDKNRRNGAGISRGDDLITAPRKRRQIETPEVKKKFTTSRTDPQRTQTSVIHCDPDNCQTDSSAQIHELYPNRKTVEVLEEQPTHITRNMSPDKNRQNEADTTRGENPQHTQTSVTALESENVQTLAGIDELRTKRKVMAVQEKHPTAKIGCMRIVTTTSEENATVIPKRILQFKKAEVESRSITSCICPEHNARCPNSTLMTISVCCKWGSMKITLYGLNVASIINELPRIVISFSVHTFNSSKNLLTALGSVLVSFISEHIRKLRDCAVTHHGSDIEGFVTKKDVVESPGVHSVSGPAISHVVAEIHTRNEVDDCWSSSKFSGKGDIFDNNGAVTHHGSDIEGFVTKKDDPLVVESPGVPSVPDPAVSHVVAELHTGTEVDVWLFGSKFCSKGEEFDCNGVHRSVGMKETINLFNNSLDSFLIKLNGRMRDTGDEAVDFDPIEMPVGLKLWRHDSEADLCIKSGNIKTMNGLSRQGNTELSVVDDQLAISIPLVAQAIEAKACYELKLVNINKKELGSLKAQVSHYSIFLEFRMDRSGRITNLKLRFDPNTTAFFTSDTHVMFDSLTPNSREDLSHQFGELFWKNFSRPWENCLSEFTAQFDKQLVLV